MSLGKRRQERAEAIEDDIAKARKTREEIVTDGITVTRAVASFMSRRTTDRFGNDLEDTFNRKPRRAQ